MRKTKLYIAISLNGKIADSDGKVDWLEGIYNPDNIDHGYSVFYESIDTTIQGNSTYNQVIGWGIDSPYLGKKNYVFTRNPNLKNNQNVDFISENHFDFVRDLKKQSGKDIWVIGGGQINTLLLNEKLIDEIQVFVMPIIIPSGIDLFESLPNQTNLKLVDSKTYSTGAVELIYQLDYS